MIYFSTIYSNYGSYIPSEEVNAMIDPVLLLIFFFCMIGCAYTSYKAGHREGIDLALTHLEAEGLIEFDDLWDEEDD